MTITLTLDTVQAEYLLERLGGPAFIDSLSSDRERSDAVSHDCIVGQLERGLSYPERAVRHLIAAHPSLADPELTAECQWFHLCHNPATAIVEHPTLGDVACCAQHVEWITTDPTPTKMVPPMAARFLREGGARVD